MKTKVSCEKLLPSVSVVIPALNSERTIGQTIESLKKLDYPQHKLEIIVVDDASTDNTAERALQYGVRVVRREKTGGCAAAKNAGVAHTKNEIIAFVDADVTVAEDWLRELVAPFKDPAVGAAGGLIKNKFRRNNAFEKYIHYDNLYRRRKEVAKSVSGSNSAYRREVFKIVGQLDPYLGEDPDYSYRVLSHGYKMIFTEKAIIFHPFPNTVLSYLKKQVYYAWQRTLIFLLHPTSRTTIMKDEITPRPFLLQPFVLAVLLFTLLLIPLFNLIKFVSLTFFVLFILLNVPFGQYVYAKEAKLVPFALVFSIPRSFVYILGVASGFISFVKLELSRETRSYRK